MPGQDFISPDFSKIRDSRNSVGRMGQGKGLAGEDCRQESFYGTRVASPDFCKVKDSKKSLVRKGQGESFCWRIDGENSLYRMSGAGCKGVASL